MSLRSKGLFLVIAAVLVAVLVIPASAVDDTAVSSDTESGDSGGGDHITIYEAPDYPTDEETGVLLAVIVSVSWRDLSAFRIYRLVHTGAISES